MFIDRVRIKVTPGAGGNGCCSFRREKYVPHGGPDGGDGGGGGDMWIVADARLTSLLDVRFHSHWKGKRGTHGKGANRHGKTGEETLVRVPPGTVIRDWDTREILGDLTREGQRFLAAKGRRGGKGNARFATSTNRVPRFAELGEPGDDREYLLELKLIAEVGLVGLPNAGKSTLLARVTAAHPKIADYPFTTLSPNLGVARLNDYRSLTIADIPGIIEGAAHGKGLGHDFLRHIERTQVLLFLLDAGDDDPLETLEILKSELAQHSSVFETRPALVAFNKIDLPDIRTHAESLQEELRAAHAGSAHAISAVTGEGVDPLLDALWHIVDTLKKEEPLPGEDTSPQGEYTYEAPYTIGQTPQGFRVEGRSVLRAVRMTDFDNEEAVHHLQSRFQRMGLFKALKKMGARDGQLLHIGDVELEYRDD